MSENTHTTYVRVEKTFRAIIGSNVPRLKFFSETIDSFMEDSRLSRMRHEEDIVTVRVERIDHEVLVLFKSGLTGNEEIIFRSSIFDQPYYLYDKLYSGIREKFPELFI